MWVADGLSAISFAIFSSKDMSAKKYSRRCVIQTSPAVLFYLSDLAGAKNFHYALELLYGLMSFGVNFPYSTYPTSQQHQSR